MQGCTLVVWLDFMLNYNSDNVSTTVYGCYRIELTLTSTSKSVPSSSWTRHCTIVTKTFRRINSLCQSHGMKSAEWHTASHAQSRSTPLHSRQMVHRSTHARLSELDELMTTSNELVVLVTDVAVHDCCNFLSFVDQICSILVPSTSQLADWDHPQSELCCGCGAQPVGEMQAKK